MGQCRILAGQHIFLLKDTHGQLVLFCIPIGHALAFHKLCRDNAAGSRCALHH